MQLSPKAFLAEPVVPDVLPVAEVEESSEHPAVNVAREDRPRTRAMWNENFIWTPVDERDERTVNKTMPSLLLGRPETIYQKINIIGISQVEGRASEEPNLRSCPE